MIGFDPDSYMLAEMHRRLIRIESALFPPPPPVPPLEERLAVLFVGGQQAVDRIVGDACEKLDALRTEIHGECAFQVRLLRFRLACIERGLRLPGSLAASNYALRELLSQGPVAIDGEII